MSEQQSQADAQRQALLAIRKLRAKLDEVQRARTEPIAIVGLSCRFPGGVGDVDSYWQLLSERRDAVGPIPSSRFDVESLYDPDPQAPGKTYSRWAGLVDGVDQFDEEFFGISPREATQTDPQQRLFLEGVWLALEHAGIAPPRLRGTATGVFVGVTTGEYGKLHDRDVALEDVSAYAGQGLANNAIAGRVSHILGLHGPSMSIDTACSSSLVAIDRACRSLRDGESTLAVAGGVNVLAVAEPLVAASRWGMFAADGHCKSFSAAADGFVRGEGCGVVVLKRLSQAQADGDRVLAVILGSAINHDGPSSGLTVPSGPAQQAVLRSALASAGIEPGAVSYIEAHGTGTSLGDPIEAEALGAVLGAERTPDRPLLIGSVKTNLGHCEAAAGVAGLIKLVLSLRHRELPAQLHFDEPSPHIRWNELALAVVDTHRPWEPIDGRRIAGVSSFGFSGTNAHVIVAEAPQPAAAEVETGARRPIEILTLSARTEAALRTLSQRYLTRLDAAPDEWSDLCHTANAGRASFAHRLSVRAADTDALRTGLRAYLDGTSDPRVVASQSAPARPRIGFLFTGQGAQYAGMGRALYAASPMVRAIFDRAEVLLAQKLDPPLGAVIRGEHPDATKLLNLTLYTQPALYVLEYALALWWRSLGVEPYAVIGHSLGEYAAAAVTGVFSFEDGLMLVADRARLMHEVTADGTMLVVNAPEAEVAPLLAGYADRVSVAGVNAPSQVTLSGARAAIEELKATCEARGWRTVALPISQAFHSPLLDEMAATFETRAAQLDYAAPNRKLVSNLTGAVIESVDAAYWRAHTREAVRFADGVAALDALGCDVLVEIGPRPTLLPLAQQVHGTAGTRRYIASLKGADHDWDALAAAVQQLHAAGVAIDWRAWDREVVRRIVDAPSYPFERRRHWIAPPARAKRSPRNAAGAQALLGARVRSPLAGAQFEAELFASGETAWLADHRIGDGALLPATALIELMLAAGTATDPALRTLTDVAILAPLRIADDAPRTLQTIVDAPAGGEATVRVYALDAGDHGVESPAGDARFHLHAEGRLTGERAAAPAAFDLAAIRARCPVHQTGEQHDARWIEAGAAFGPAFRGVTQVWSGENEALAEIRATVATELDGTGRPHPAVLDACFQSAGDALAPGASLYLPFALAKLELFAQRWPAGIFAHATVVKADPDAPRVDILVCDANGTPLARAQGLTFKSVSVTGGAPARAALYEVRWEPVAAATLNGTTVRAGAPWLLLADARGTADALAAALDAAGAAYTLLPSGTTAGAIAAALGAAEAPRTLIDCRPIDSPPIALDAPADETLGAMSAVYANTLALLQSLAALDDPPALSVVTCESAPVDSARAVPAHAIVAALRKTALAELPELRCRTIDVDRDDVDVAQTLLRELLAADEPDVAWHGGRRLVPRLVRAGVLPRAGEDELIELQPAASGVIAEAAFVVRPRRAPGLDEIEIDVRATGLNFRDALNALAMLPGTVHKIGGECAGIVARAGERSGFVAGERVMAFCPGQSGTFVTVAAHDAVRKPERLSFAQAAALPIVTMTAIFALDRVAKVRRGERVLIHAAAGGLGLAAVQLATARGAIVYATAGSPEKRAYLRALGVEHAMDSRRAGFAAEIAERTGGRGVDVVLNSLSGPLIAEGLRALAPGGRFVEAGKRDVLTPAEARALRPDVAYTVFDLGEEAQRDTALVPALLAQTVAMIDDGTFAPLPVNAEPFANAHAALDALAHARRIGKVVLVHGTHQPGVTGVRADATYAVTGGFGALGLQAATWLADRGATSLLLIGRTEREAANGAIAALRARGLTVQTAATDVAGLDALRAAAGALPAQQPLRGVVHCAGVLADATVRDQDAAAFGLVAAPKAGGALALHQLGSERDLEVFVLFSSAAATFGSPGQANYAAAGAAMDEIARVRRARGGAALCIDWGPWAGGGMADAERVRRRLDELVPFDAQTGFATVEAALAAGVEAPVAVQVRSWDRYLALHEGTARDPFFDAVRGRRDAGPAVAVIPFGVTLTAADPAARRRLLLDHLHEQAAGILGLRAGERIDELAALQDRGLDSLMSVELRNALAGSLGLKLSPTVAFDYPTLATLADHLLPRLFAEPAPPADVKNEVEAIAALSEAEAEAFLLRELEGADV